MSNNYWLEQEKKFLEAIKDVDVPNETLNNVDYIEKEWRKNGLPKLCSYLTGR